MLIRFSGRSLAVFLASSLSLISPLTAQDDTDAPRTAPSSTSAVPDQQKTIEEKVLARMRRRTQEQRVQDGDTWKKHPPIWSIRDVTKEPAPYASPYNPAPGGGHFPGGPSGQWGFPYYYTANLPDTAYSGMMGGGFGGPGMYGPAPGFGAGAGFGYGSGYGGVMDPGLMGPGPGGGFGGGGFVGGGGYYGPGFGPAMGFGAGPGFGGYGFGGGPGFGGGYGLGNAYAMAGLPGQLPGNPYYTHFGPGFYRFQEAGHYRFPYYSYRRPWYFPGHPSYNRDTNVPW